MKIIRVGFLFSLLIASLVLFVMINKTGIPNYGAVVRGRFTRSGQPNAIGFTHLRKAGADIILKLTTDGEYPNSLEKQQFKGRVKFGYVSTDHRVDPYYCQEGEQWADWIDAKLKKGFWVHVHCRLGKDRVGLVVGEWMIRHGGYTYSQVKQTWPKYGTPFDEYQTCLQNAVPVQ
jgi:hypothetical protein